MAGSGILVVDDDADIRETLRDALEFEGYAVDVAANGRDAWESLRPEALPALILLDLMMPVMNGAEFLRLLRSDAQMKSVPVVVVTAFGASAGGVAAESQGLLPKPLDLELLLRTVERYCPLASAANP
jgi:CheY-like chemotaxis protein